jgi:hypothetical protein
MYDHKRSFKALITHVLVRCGVIDVLYILRFLRGFDVSHLRKRNMRDIFSHIYAKGIWVGQNGSGSSLSGIGSTNVATAGLVVQLSVFLKEVGCRQLVDIGCGDFNWMRNVEGNFDYVGIDVVPRVIDMNNAEFGNERRRFICMDATQTAIRPGDVAVCREVLFHLSFVDGLQLLRNIKTAGFKYVLLTSDNNVWFNSDIRNGDYRPINLSKSPFSLPQPMRELNDSSVTTDRNVGRVLAVWQDTDLPADLRLEQ